MKPSIEWKLYQTRRGSELEQQRTRATKKARQRIVELPPRPVRYVTVAGVDYLVVWDGSFAGPEQCGLPRSDQRGGDWEPPRARERRGDVFD
jgi:hypothetical protein